MACVYCRSQITVCHLSPTLRIHSKSVCRFSTQGKKSPSSSSSCGSTAERSHEKIRFKSHIGQSVATTAETESFLADINELIVVAGATGGVGQLVTAKLLERGYRVRAIARTEEKGAEFFGSKLAKGLQVVSGDLRDEDFVTRAVTGADSIICCLGTTAFPSKRWAGGNPEETDFKATTTLIKSSPETIARFVLLSSAGVDRAGQFPFFILNAFGVLKEKKKGEDNLKSSGLPYTIVRPGRLTDGPYTSFDLNTLLKATSGARQGVKLSSKDDLQEEASRIAVAEVVVHSLKSLKALDKTFSIASTEGKGPGQDFKKWEDLLSALA